MRTYLRIQTIPPVSDDIELVMACHCGKFKRLAEFVPAGVRPLRIQSINLLRLMQWMGEFASEHAACQAKPKSDDDLPF